MKVINEITSDEELTASIIEYGRLTEEIEAKMASIQETLNSIKALEKQSSSSLKSIERYVIDFQKTKVVADK
jgi:predicted  nucleic acid-binding Zn-ribbon protein